jgi:uncharacterized membrane protein YgcG
MKRLFARAGLSVIAAMWVAAIAATPAQADEGWVIISFNSTIQIRADSTLDVAEDIRVDFGNLAKHGIFRTIPLRYRYDDKQDRYYDLAVSGVTDGSAPVPFTLSTVSDNQVIKIGDPNITVTGVHRYVISYTVRGAMNSFADHDELFWNVDGALWPVRKQMVVASVKFPQGSFQKAACYEGTSGSRETCSYANSANTSCSGQPAQCYTGAGFTSNRPLGPGEQMSVVVGLNKGAVTVPAPFLEARARQFPQDAFDINPLTVAVSAIILLAGLGLIVWYWLTHARDRAYLSQYYLTNDPREGPEPLLRHQPLVVEFDPPQHFRPAQLGLLLDESADTKDVTATIVDLAVRGHLTIGEVPNEKDWLLTWKSNDATPLQPFEKTILDGLFTGRQEVKISELKGTFHATLQQAEGEMVSDAMARKWFSHNPTYSRLAWGCSGVLGIVAGGYLAFQLGMAFGWGMVGVAIVLVGLVVLFVSRRMTQRTAAGRDVMQHALGFRLYMTTAEKYRQQFAEKAQIFTQLLPYAIVFGCVDRWAKAFAGIDMSATNNNWYAGSAPFQAALLSSSLQSFNSGLSSAIAASPPSSGSSSGFGGGGSSGGGGGGGGGGSW